MTQTTLAKFAQKPKPADRGKTLIAAWRESGLSQAAYARQERIGTHLLTYWSKNFRYPRLQPPSRARRATAHI